MFEIGSSLREARERRGLTLADAEAETKIRSRYLGALENERFDVLPGDAYARGFLRTYAEFLGLDGDLYADEFAERFSAPEEQVPLAVPRASARPLALGPLLDRWILGIAALLAVMGALVWLGADRGERASVAPPPAPTQVTRPPPAPPPPRRRSAAPAVLTLVAVRGDCWLSVHAGSAQGRTLYEATLPAGGRLRFGVRKPVWIRVGAPWNLDATVAGKRVVLPRLTADILASARGVRVESHG